MSKGLEALKKIKQIETTGADMGRFTMVKIGNCPNFWELFDTIEKELKAYEKLEESLGFDPTIFKQDFETLMKEHKALKIIKDNFEIPETKGFDIKNNSVAFGCLVQKNDLTIKQFRLLEEIGL